MLKNILFTLILISLFCACQTVPATVQPPTGTPLIGKLTFAGSTTIQPLASRIGDEFTKQNPLVSLDIAAGGSAVGIKAVKDGSVDIGMASRALTEEEANGLQQYQIAIDVIAIVVHPDNPVSNLTLKQLESIYMGETTNWKELGEADQPIVPVAREKTSGTRGAFDELVLENQEPAALGIKLAVTAGDMAAVVSGHPSAIGYVGFGNLEKTLKLVSIEGITPSVASAKDRSYPLIRPLMFMTGPLSQPLALQFIDFVLSPGGQQLVEEFGWVKVK